MNPVSIAADLSIAGAVRSEQKVNVEPQRDASEHFADVLSRSLQQVNQSLLHSERMAEGLVSGQVDHLHDVMIAAETASLTLQTAVQVRNKVVEAYQEIMRMQM